MYTNKVEDCPDNIRFKNIAKFTDKILVWCAFTNRILSRPIEEFEELGESLSEELRLK